MRYRFERGNLVCEFSSFGSVFVFPIVINVLNLSLKLKVKVKKKNEDNNVEFYTEIVIECTRLFVYFYMCWSNLLCEMKTYGFSYSVSGYSKMKDSVEWNGL